MEIEKLKQGDIVTLNITGTGSNGEGVGRVGNFVTFIPFALPTEEVSARVTYVKKSFCNAVLKEVLRASAMRVTSPCNRFMRCGGCSWLNLKYEEQLRQKKENLRSTLAKFAGYTGEIAEVVPSAQYAYRNKLQLPFGMTDGKVSLGFYQEGTHKVVSIGKCFLHGDWAENLIVILKEWAGKNNLTVYTDENKRGLLRHVVARYLDAKLQVTLVLNGDKIPFQKALLELLQARFANVTLYLNINKEDTNVILGEVLVPVAAHPQTIRILGVEAEINPFSFLQVNDEIRDKLYLQVLQEVRKNFQKNTEKIAVDAYAGVGILGAILAKEGVSVYNIEIIKEATADGDLLASANGVKDLVTNLTGDSAELLPPLLVSLAAEHKSATMTVLLDPPRKGCDARVLSAVTEAAEQVPLSIIYISCNPATLSRDLALLQSHFVIAAVIPFDMFPNTPHVETLVVLRTKKSPNSNSEESPTPGIGNLK